MREKEMIWEAVLFGSILFMALGAVIISFIVLYQRKRNRHKQEMIRAQENFLHELLHAKSEMQEQTLQDVASEIHDNFNPTLSVINLNLASVMPSLDDTSKETILDTKTMVKQLMTEMKSLSISLKANNVSRVGLMPVLEQYINRIRKTGFYQITLKKDGAPYRLTNDKEIILLRMCQEILNNIVKHADAKNISVNILYDEHFFSLEIADDGKGFDRIAIKNDPEKQDSTGLQNLKHRSDAINAELSINSHPGKGTSVSITLTNEKIWESPLQKSK